MTLTQKISEDLKSIKEWYCMTKADIAKELYEGCVAKNSKKQVGGSKSWYLC